MTLREYLVEKHCTPLPLNRGTPGKDDAAFAIRCTEKNFALVQSFCIEYKQQHRAVVLNDDHKSFGLDWYVFSNQPSW